PMDHRKNTWKLPAKCLRLETRRAGRILCGVKIRSATTDSRGNGVFFRLFSACSIALFPGACSAAPIAPGNAGMTPADLPTAKAPQLISAADPRFLYEGRFDFSDTNAPVVIWEANRIRLDFSGNTLGLLFDEAKGQNFFNTQVDGSNTIVEASEGKPVSPATLSGFGSGRHHLLLFKRSEATAGTVRFRGVELAAGAKAWAPRPPAYKLRMEFIGDSITVGACNEDGPADQWENRRTHDSALSYAALTADAFNADHRNISVSGMGIVTGYVPMKAGQIWDRLYPGTNSARADLTKWVPQVVFVNFGENDDSFTRVHGQPFPDGFTEGYVALVRAIQTAYPEAHIVLLRGGMFGGAKSEPLRKAWEAAVTQLEAGDKDVSHFVFSHWTHTHPRVKDDRIMAAELVDWLRRQEFMQPYR
ncbi:MAG TPA: GDSL-type esterase/lipase family protein, partial [Verrucomicrobiae bacterium]|nr:GDSL-type esterase/lipase family protein [Verrucomicrobiae bacterium]